MGALQRIAFVVVSAGLLALLMVPDFASAQAARTWVSGTGNDANDCSRTAPCRTFGGAIMKTAFGGEIDCVDSGDFGTLTVFSSINIDCNGTVAGLSQIAVVQVAQVDPAFHASLRHLVIDCAGNSAAGIHILAGASLLIEGVTVQHCGNGIDVVNGTGVLDLTIRDSVIRDNSQHGVYLAGGNGRVVHLAASDSTLSSNALTGIRVDDLGSATLTNVTVSSNGTHGVSARSAGAGAKISLDRVTTSMNGTSGVLATGAAAVIYLSNVLTTGNAYGIYPASGGATYVSFGNNRTGGNTTADGSPTTVLPQF